MRTNKKKKLNETSEFSYFFGINFYCLFNRRKKIKSSNEKESIFLTFRVPSEMFKIETFVSTKDVWKQWNNHGECYKYLK